MGAQSGKNGAQSGVNTTAQTGVNTTAQTGAQSAKTGAQTGQAADVQVHNATTSNAKKGAKRGRKKKNED
ncbi:hypothetical protein A2U01_0074270, partial [Trifolium medium]|nr:hypothetical protein [Trifolium medium]